MSAEPRTTDAHATATAQAVTPLSSSTTVDKSTILSASDEALLPLAVDHLALADVLLVCTGAGMGVSSGLGTFRGRSAGVWPPLVGTEFGFEDLSNPVWFVKPRRAPTVYETANFGYAFWQFRFQAYTRNPPHDGYRLIQRWRQEKAKQRPDLLGGFSVTSNIDGAWRRCGWPEHQLHEVHGSLDYMQCVNNCTDQPTNIWPSKDEEWQMKIDPTTRAIDPDEPLPACPNCAGRARTNVLMFGDFGFDGQREAHQESSFNAWLQLVKKTKARVAVIEIGAGVAIPTIRHLSERIVRELNSAGSICTLLRINPEHPNIPISGTHSKDRLLSMTSDSLTILRRMDEAFSLRLETATAATDHQPLPTKFETKL